MHLLLLVSIQMMTQMMERLNRDQPIINSNTQTKRKTNPLPKNDLVLCNHCKRTASNGIRCLGMCVADDNY